MIGKLSLGFRCIVCHILMLISLQENVTVSRYGNEKISIVTGGYRLANKELFTFPTNTPELNIYIFKTSLTGDIAIDAMLNFHYPHSLKGSSV